MYIRHTLPQDLSRVMEIYAHARVFMAENGNPRQWGTTNWPPEDLIREDIRKQNSFVCVDNEHVCAVFYYIAGHAPEPCYNNITDGQWIGSEDYGVVHRIATDGTVKGAGQFCIEWAFSQCGHLRIDTHGDNTVMQHVLQKIGFTHVGTIYVEEDNDPRFAYERLK